MFANLSISQKLYAGFAVILLIILVLVLSTWRGFDQVDSSVRLNIHTYEVINESSELLGSLLNIETGARGFVITGRDQFLGPFEAGEREFQSKLAQLRELTRDNPVQQRRLGELQALHDQWLGEDITGNIELRRQVSAGTQPFDALIERVSAGGAKLKMDAMRRILSEIQREESALLEQRTASMNAAKSLSLTILLVGGLIATVLAISVAFMLSRSIAGRLQQVVEVARNVAQGRLDSNIERAGSDEIGTLLDAFATMQERLREMIGQIRAGAVQLVSAAQNISSASTQLSVSTQEQSQAASSMAATVEELTVSINHVADNANEAHGLSSDSGRQSAEGGAVIQETLVSMQRIADTVQGAAVQIAELGQHSDQISSIVNVIKEIADQTNLLALNAAVEAARAGEQGKGFAVVAQEVRNLAQRSAEAAKDVKSLIAASSERVRQGAATVGDAGTAMNDIQEVIARLTLIAGKISQSSLDQGDSITQVNSAIRTIDQATQQNASLVEEVAAASNQLDEQARTLADTVARFVADSQLKDPARSLSATRRAA